MRQSGAGRDDKLIINFMWPYSGLFHPITTLLSTLYTQSCNILPQEGVMISEPLAESSLKEETSNSFLLEY